MPPPKHLVVSTSGRSLPLCSYPLYPMYVNGSPPMCLHVRAMTGSGHGRHHVPRCTTGRRSPVRPPQKRAEMAGRTDPGTSKMGFGLQKQKVASIETKCVVTHKSLHSCVCGYCDSWAVSSGSTRRVPNGTVWLEGADPSNRRLDYGHPDDKLGSWRETLSSAISAGAPRNLSCHGRASRPQITSAQLACSPRPKPQAAAHGTRA